MNGMEGEIFIDTRETRACERETAAPAMDWPKEVTTGEMKPIILTAGMLNGAKKRVWLA